MGKRKGWVETQVGFFNPKDAKSFDALPADLRPVAAHAAPNGKGIGVGSSTSIIQISEAALKEKGYNAIDARIRELGLAVVETHQDRALTVRGNDKAMAAVLREHFVETALPYAPAFKLEPATGRQQLLDKVRASKTEMDVQIRTWDARDVDAVIHDLKSTSKDTVSLLEDGLTIRATLDKNELKGVLRMDAVSMVREVPEYQLQANFVLLQDPPVIQVGEAEHTGSATPYWDAGVDGGGCGYCSDAFATACTSDAGCVGGTCVHASATQCNTSVQPVVVAILDNGASTDAATLAHSASPLTEAAIAALIAGNNHRKIRAYQVLGSEVGALGTTCDNVLSGGQTHGNVVAGIIAGNASALGFSFQKNGNAGSFGDVRRINLDGSARGARLHIQDAGPVASCPAAEVTERGLVSGLGGTLTVRMNDAYATGTRLHVMPFGVPTWIASGIPTANAGTYTADSSDIDRYLLNNLEYQVFVPVGNKGATLTSFNNIWPDFFDGEASALSDPGSANPGVTRPLQVSPPSTAKNSISAGATCSDVFTMFGAFNEEENVQNYSSKGPATSASLRTAPILVGVGNDRTPTGGGSSPRAVSFTTTEAGAPAPFGMYTVKSKDNDQDGTVDTEIDEQARGTSFGAASIAAAAALMEDYFHQGFYPTGDRVQADRVPVLSGAAVKALLAASANFSEQQIGENATGAGRDGLDTQVMSTRGSVVTISGNPRVLGNNQQGYGRPIVSQVLPLVNWANVGIPPDGAITLDTIERPGLGLLVWEHGLDPDGAGSDVALPVFSGTMQEHHFTVLGTQGEIRACLVWPDPPGNTLVNDLDLELISPTGTIYDGNVYNPASQAVGQWGLGRTVPPDFGDIFNPIECVHLHDNPDNNPATNDNQIVSGIWTLRVKQGAGGAVPGAITQINGANEDANGNNRLDAGEDLDADNQLDKGGQPFAAVVSGPLVATKDVSNPAYFGDYPASIARVDKIRYTCSDQLSVLILDGDADASSLHSFVTARVLNAAGAQVDSESNFDFAGSNASFTSGAVPVRFGAVGTSDNGVLEGDTGYTIEVSYTDQTGGSRPAV
ncbi:MAG TPA: S8 family serine peptidase, partial [Gemmatimonadales bacterium]|nr:S8 family serine peptidase [Gemmatimonadales bacterium]